MDSSHHRRLLGCVFIFGLALVVAGSAPALQAASGLGWNADALSVELAGVQQLPPVAAGVNELKFADFFVTPVGPEGLVLTEKLKQLAGQRVRITGFMVRQTRSSPGVAILSPFAMATHEGEYGVCDDLPPQSLFVDVAKYRDIAVPYTRGPLVLTGKLELGRREEADGRVSFVRLVLDPEQVAPKATSVVAADNASVSTATPTNAASR